MGILQDDVAGDIGSVPRCQACGSERVVRQAWTCWNRNNGLWELEEVRGHAHCHQCDDETTLVWMQPNTPPINRIRDLNDRFRTEGTGNGSVMLTIGVQERGSAFAVAAIKAVRVFDDFSENNDPWGEHDFGAVEIDGQKVFWKIDYYAPDLQNGSENSGNEALTHRVLTIMLASEY